VKDRSQHAAEKDRGPAISVQVHRSRRFPFVAGAQITALDSDAQVAAHIEDLSLFGCFVETMTPFVARTKVSIRTLAQRGCICRPRKSCLFSRICGNRHPLHIDRTEQCFDIGRLAYGIKKIASLHLLL
jgi:hypothetical protein